MVRNTQLICHQSLQEDKQQLVNGTEDLLSSLKLKICFIVRKWSLLSSRLCDSLINGFNSCSLPLQFDSFWLYLYLSSKLLSKNVVACYQFIYWFTKEIYPYILLVFEPVCRYSWKTTEWTECKVDLLLSQQDRRRGNHTGMCGGGTQTREVYCVQASTDTPSNLSPLRSKEGIFSVLLNKKHSWEGKCCHCIGLFQN